MSAFAAHSGDNGSNLGSGLLHDIKSEIFNSSRPHIVSCEGLDVAGRPIIAQEPDILSRFAELGELEKGV